jgi:hypothetical protein
MPTLLYREDIDAVRERLTKWWNGGDIGRPVMLLTAPREEPLEKVRVLPKPRGWVTDYSTGSFPYRVNLAARRYVKTWCLGERVPSVAPDLGPGTLALYLGSRGVELPGTVWFSPCITSPEMARFEYDPKNFYWNFTLRLAREQARIGKGKFQIEFPDLIEGLDILASMRGTELLLMDLLERPEWVRQCLRKITDLYFRHYDVLYDLMRDEVGGSVFWAWAPGRVAKLQCDFSAMISPALFKEFMVPVLTEMTERLSYSLYHWDGPGAIPHHDLLLSIPRLNMIQWTTGAGAEPTQHSRWWPLYHKTFEAGKKVFIHVDGELTPARLAPLKREFGRKFKQFLINGRTASPAAAEELLRAVMVD